MVSSNCAVWENPEQSVGTQSAQTRREIIWEATGPAQALFLEQLRPRITRTLEENIESLERSQRISQTICICLCMVGKSPETAKPTVILSCRDKVFRKKALKLIADEQILEAFPAFLVRGMERLPARQLGRSTIPSQAETSVDAQSVFALGHIINTSGTLLETSGGQRATLGGVLLIDEAYYGYTALHARRECFEELEALADEQGNLKFDDESESGSLRTLSKRSSLASVGSFHRLKSDNIHTSNTDTLHFATNIQPQSRVLEDDTRVKIGTLAEEFGQTGLDYEIFPIHNAMLQIENRVIIPGAAGVPPKTLVIREIARKIIAADICISTGQSGLIRGKILDNPYFLKMAGEHKYQEMWPVQLTTPIVPGDSGSWVVDSHTGSLYGHIVAGDASRHRAYIIAATEVLKDMRTIVDGAISLPTHEVPWIQGQSHDLRSQTILKDRVSNSEELLKTHARNKNSQYRCTSRNANKRLKSRSAQMCTRTWPPKFSKKEDVSMHRSSRVTFQHEHAEKSDTGTNNADFYEAYRELKDDKEMHAFVSRANRSEVESGSGDAGHKRTAWTNLPAPTQLRGHCPSRKVKVMTCSGLFRYLRQERRQDFSQSESDIRFICIEDLSPNYALALLESADHSEIISLSAAMRYYISKKSQLSVQTNIHGRLFGFQWSFSTLLLRPTKSQAESWLKDYSCNQQKNPLRYNKNSFKENLDTIMRKEDFSLLICGSHNSQWTAYCFVSAHSEDESALDEYCDDIDPIANEPIFLDQVYQDPREYFLRVVCNRMTTLKEDWEILVRWAKRQEEFILSYPLVQELVYFALVQQLQGVLISLIHSLELLILPWNRFVSEYGDINFFENSTYDHEYWYQPGLTSLQGIRAMIQELDLLLDQLKMLKTSLDDRALSFQSHLCYKTIDYQRTHARQTSFVVSVVAPIMTALLLMTVRTESAPYRQESIWFLPTIVVVVILNQLCFLAFFSDMGQNFWAGIHRKIERLITRWKALFESRVRRDGAKEPYPVAEVYPATNYSNYA